MQWDFHHGLLGKRDHKPVELIFVLDLTADRLGREPIGIVPDPNPIQRGHVALPWLEHVSRVPLPDQALDEGIGGSDR